MALDTSKAKDSLFGNIKKAKEPQSIETEIKSETLSHHVDLAPSIAEVNKQETEENRVEELAKWRQFDKITALLTSEQKEGLDRVAKKLMKHRSKELKGNENKERITANTLIRALIDNFLKNESSFQFEVLVNESDVCDWLSRMMKK